MEGLENEKETHFREITLERSLPGADMLKLRPEEQEEPNRQREGFEADVNDYNMENFLST